MSFTTPTEIEPAEDYDGPTFYACQENGQPWQFTAENLQTKITNLTAKAAAITPGDEPEDETSEEHATWQRLTDEKARFTSRAFEFTALKNSIP